MNTVVLDLSLNEVWPLSNLLNEVCNGLYIKNFEESISVKEGVAEELLHRLGVMLHSESDESYCEIRPVKLEKWELKVILNAMKEVYKKIDPWEFSIRIGIDVSEMQVIESKLTAALNN